MIRAATPDGVVFREPPLVNSLATRTLDDRNRLCRRLLNDRSDYTRARGHFPAHIHVPNSPASMSASAAPLTFTAAVAPRAVRARTRTVVRVAGRAHITSAAVEKINVNDVKDHLDRGFVLVDIRDPEECAETGYKSSWKNIVVRTRTFPHLGSRGPHLRARTHGNAKTRGFRAAHFRHLANRRVSVPFGIPVDSTRPAPRIR